MRSILIVEDDIAILLTLEEQLSSIPDIEIMKAISKNEAIEQIESISNSSSFDVAIVDLQFADQFGVFSPDAGFEVIDYLRNKSKSTQVIINTIRYDRPVWDMANERPNVRFVFTKPWSSKVLREAVNACLAGTAVGIQLKGNIEGVNG